MTQSRLFVGTKDCIAGKRERFAWTMRLVGSTGVQCGLVSGDKVRFRLGATTGAAASLAFESSTPSTNGSSVTIVSLGSSTTDATGVVELRATDTASLVGAMPFELDILDVGDSNREAQPIRGTLRFLPSMTG